MTRSCPWLIALVALAAAPNSRAADDDPLPPVSEAKSLGEELARRKPPIAEVELVPAVLTPRLIGEPLDIAVQRARLAEMPLHSGVYYIAPDKWRLDLIAGRIYLQIPVGGVAAPRGTPLAVWTLAQADPARRIVTMPDLRGKLLLEGAVQLEREGLPLSTPVGDRPSEEGHRQRKIVDQYPPAGREVYEGTSVALVPDRE